MVKTEYFPPNIGNKARMSVLTAAIQHYTGGPRQCNKESI